jgi:hypothetical protein
MESPGNYREGGDVVFRECAGFRCFQGMFRYLHLPATQGGHFPVKVFLVFHVRLFCNQSLIEKHENGKHFQQPHRKANWGPSMFVFLKSRFD